MKSVQMYKSNNNKLFETPTEALLEDLKENMLVTGEKPSSVKTEDVISTLKWVIDNQSEVLYDFIIEMVEVKFGVKLDPPPVVEEQQHEEYWPEEQIWQI